MAETFSVEAVLSLYDKGFSSGFERAKEMVEKTTAPTNNFGQVASKVTKSVGKGMAAVGTATTAMGVTAVKNFGSFQSSLNKAAVIAGGSSKDVKSLADEANRMGAELPISAQDAADAMVAMARDGASIGTIKKEFPAIAQAATAAGADLQTTASVVQQSMNIWGKSLKSPQQAAAILTQTANLSNASIEDMQQALATIGGTASSAGISMQTTSTAIGLLTNKGFSAAQASLDLNHAILQMQAPSSKAQKVMEQLGISYTDSTGKMKPFKQILKEVAKATDGMGDSQKSAALKTLFGTAGMQAMIPLLKSVKDESGNTTTSWDAFSKSMNKASSSTATSTRFLKEQANEMQKNVGSKIEQVGGNWESLSNKAMQAKGGVSGALLDMANNALEWATKSNNGIAKVIRGFIGLSPVIGPVVAALGGFLVVLPHLVKGFQMVQTGVTALNSVLLANPWVLLAAAVAAVVTGLIYFFTQTKTGQQLWQGFTQFLQEAWVGIKALAVAIWTGIGNFIKSIPAGIEAIWNGVTGFFSGIWTAISSFTSSIWNGITSFLSSVWNGIVTTAQGIFNGIKSFIQNIWNGIKFITATVWNGIKLAVSIAMNNIRSTISSIMTAVRTVISSVWNGIKSVIGSAVGSVVSRVAKGFGNVVSTVRSGMSKAISAVTSKAQSLVSAGRDFVMGFVKGIKNAIGSAAEAAAKMAKSAVTAAKKALHIKSPSHVMRDEVGYYVVAGMAKGITDNVALVERASRKLADSAVLPTDMSFSLGANNLSSAISKARADGFDVSANNSLRIEVPVNLDGKTIAKVTAQPLQEELNRRQLRSQRLHGNR